MSRPLDWPRSLRIACVAALIPVNVAFIWLVMQGADRALDWSVMVEAASLAGTPALYECCASAPFVWSPIAAYPLQLITLLGVWGWRAVLIASAMSMPSWRMSALVLLSLPFWQDFATGNILTLVFLAAVWALRGSQLATFAFFAIALLRPAPVLAPLCLWLVVKRPEWRQRVAVMFVVHALLVILTGLGDEWIATLLMKSGALQESGWNWGPTQFFGLWWMLAGVPLGIWLFLKNRPGWAGLAISPYVWGYYLFFAFPQVNRAASSPPRSL